jgi:hypothetical protein
MIIYGFSSGQSKKEACQKKVSAAFGIAISGLAR